MEAVQTVDVTGNHGNRGHHVAEVVVGAQNVDLEDFVVGQIKISTTV